MSNVTIRKGCIITWADLEEASVGDSGYFGNTTAQLVENVETHKVCVLKDIDDKDPSICLQAEMDGQLQGFSMFLPERLAHDYRPFEKFSEFKDLTGVRLFRTVALRQRVHGLSNYYMMINKRVNCYYGKTPKLKSLCGIDVQTLCAMYEIKDRDGNWVPCGVRV